MIDPIFMIPLLLVCVGTLVVRYRVMRSKLARRHWAVVAALACVAFVLPLSVGAWIPDFLGQRLTVATAQASTGHEFRVTQQWNHLDFYTVQLEITLPDGTLRRTTLNGDDPKRWRMPLQIDEQNRLAKVTLSSGRVAEVSW